MNAAAATIEAFVERRQHVLLEVIESFRSSFPRKQEWNDKKELYELVINPSMMSLVDKIKKYVTSIPCEDLNQQHALLGDVLKGVLDIIKHEAVSVHKITILLGLIVSCLIDIVVSLLQENKSQDKVIKELMNEGCVMATEIMAFANLDLFKSDSLKSMVLF